MVSVASLREEIRKDFHLPPLSLLSHLHPNPIYYFLSCQQWVHHPVCAFPKSRLSSCAGRSHPALLWGHHSQHTKHAAISPPSKQTLKPTWKPWMQIPCHPSRIRPAEDSRAGDLGELLSGGACRCWEAAGEGGLAWRARARAGSWPLEFSTRQGIRKLSFHPPSPLPSAKSGHRWENLNFQVLPLTHKCESLQAKPPTIWQASQTGWRMGMESGWAEGIQMDQKRSAWTLTTTLHPS